MRGNDWRRATLDVATLAAVQRSMPGDSKKGARSAQARVSVRCLAFSSQHELLPDWLARSWDL